MLRVAKNIALLAFSVFFLNGCLSSRLWNKKSFEENILGVIKLEKNQTPIIVGEKYSYTLIGNGTKIIKFFKTIPNLGINLEWTDITLDPDGMFTGYLALQTLKKATDKERNILIENQFDEDSNGYYSRVLKITGHTVEVKNKDLIHKQKNPGKLAINIKLTYSKFNTIIKVMKTPVYIAADATLVGGAAGVGTTGMAVLLPIVIISQTFGADF